MATSIPDALQKTGAILSGETPAHAWSAHAKAILNNLKRSDSDDGEGDVGGIARERISSSDVALPTRRYFRDAIRVFAGRSGTNAYVVSKRGSLNPNHIEAVIAGCKTNKVGSGSVRHLTQKYVVVEP